VSLHGSSTVGCASGGLEAGAVAGRGAGAGGMAVTCRVVVRGNAGVERKNRSLALGSSAGVENKISPLQIRSQPL
jgi:hypothetical protein